MCLCVGLSSLLLLPFTFLLQLGSQPEIQEFSLSYSSFSPIGDCHNKHSLSLTANGRRSHGELEGRSSPSPGDAYHAASTNSESPYWRRGVVLPQDPLELFGMPLQIVRTAPFRFGHPDDLVEVPMLPPDQYGCGLGCTRFTGTLAAVEEHEHGCAH